MGAHKAAILAAAFILLSSAAAGMGQQAVAKECPDAVAQLTYIWPLAGQSNGNAFAWYPGQWLATQAAEENYTGFFGSFEDAGQEAASHSNSSCSMGAAEDTWEMAADEALPAAQKYDVLLKARHFVPAMGIGSELKTAIGKISKTKLAERIHVLMQLERLPTAEERKKLKESGIELLAYVPNNAWYVSIPAGRADALASEPIVRAIDAIRPEYKVSPLFAAGGAGIWPADETGKTYVVVEFHEDMPLDYAANLVERRYGVVYSKAERINALVTAISVENLAELAREDSVQWIEPTNHPVAGALVNARPAIGADIVQAPPYSLDGTNIDAFVYEAGGIVDHTHDDFGNRVTPIGWPDVSAGWHATLVAGIIGGDGTLSDGNYRGVAPNVDLISDMFDTANPTVFQNSYTNAVNTFGIDVANNSWAYALDSIERCGLTGLYTADSEIFDDMVRWGVGIALPVVFSAGNERDKGLCGTDPSNLNNNYEIMPPPATAKNVITLGAVSSIDEIADLSNWGPTNDGRLKPEVVAPGCYICSTYPDNNYACGCGTSGSAPMVTGSIALMMQKYREIYGADALPSTYKALLAHTAQDLNTPGPDYKTGYGRINVKKAVDMIINKRFAEQFVAGPSGDMDRYFITVPAGTAELKVTVAWDDYPGGAFNSKDLANNINLLLIDPGGGWHRPWVLDQNNPSAGATTCVSCVDEINNIEQAYVANPQAGTWEVRVIGSSIPYPDQTYSLVSEFLGITPGGCVPMGETQLTTSSYNQTLPDIYENTIVYEDSRNGNLDIYMYDLLTLSETQVTSEAANQQRPAVYGNTIAWADYRSGNWDIYMCDLSKNGTAGGCLATDAKTAVTTEIALQSSPSIYGTKMAWHDRRNGTQTDIYMCDLSKNGTAGGCLSADAKTRITSDPKNESNADIYESKIVWHMPGVDANVFMCDLALNGFPGGCGETDQKTPIVTVPGGQAWVQIYGNTITWEDNRNGNEDTYRYDLTTSTEYRVTSEPQDQNFPAIYGTKIVWDDGRNDASDIYMCDLALNGTPGGCLETDAKTRVTTATGSQKEPAIYKDNIVWLDDRNGNWDIYMATLSPSCTGNQPPTAAIIAPADGAIVALGDTVTFTGNGNDAEDGALTGSSLTWGSNIDGIIGNGETFSTSVLSVGKHTITLTATDFAGTIGQDSVEVTVGCVEEEIQITTDTNDQRFPAIYGDKIVWQDARNGNLDIYMYDLSTLTETQITTNTADQFYSAIYGDTIVWDDYRNGSSNRDIYMYDLLTSDENQITTNIYDQYDPAIYDTNIVWMDKRGGGTYPWDIYIYDTSTSTENSVTTNTYDQMFPAIYGSKIVWQDYRPGGGVPGIYMYDSNTGIQSKLTSSVTKQFTPVIYEDKVVWYDNRNGNYDIYMYNLSTSTETRITTNTANQYNPAIYADKIVWEDYRNGNADIYMYNLSTSTETRITTNDANHYSPAIYADKIVWYDNRNGNYDIYMATLGDLCGSGNQPPTISGIPDQNITEDSGLNSNLVDLWAYASDPESADNLLTFTITAETSTAVVDCTISESRYVSCVTKMNQFGFSDVTVRVSDGNSTDTDVFRVNVLAVNDPPMLAGLPNQSLDVNSGANNNLVDLWQYASDIETADENLAFAIVSETNTAVVGCGISSNRYVNCAVQLGQSGYSDVTIQVSDGSLTGSDATRVNVAELNNPPVISSYLPAGDPTIAEGEQQVFSITASDPDGDPLSVKWYLAAQPAGTGNSYTYAAGYSSSGSYYVTVIVSDGSLQAVHEWLLTVAEVCDVPYDGFVIDRNLTLCPGIYNLVDTNADGAIVIDSNSVTLDCNGTVVYGDGTGKGIVVRGYIPAEWYVDGNTERELDANKIISNEAGFEASIAYKQGITIKNCELSGYEHGVAIIGGDGITVQNVTAHDNAGAGIGFQGLRNSTIKNNTVYGNAKGGIAVQAGKQNVIELNEVYGNAGAGIGDVGRADIIRNNNVHDNESGIAILGADMQVRNNTVLNNNLGGGENSYGIVALFATGAQIIGNNVQNSPFGIRMLSSNEMTVEDNNVSGAATGIGIGAWLFTAGDLNKGAFRNNRVLNSTKTGMYLTDGVFGIGNKFGIHDVVLQGNYFENPGVWDLHLDDRGTSYLWGVRVGAGESIRDMNVSVNSFMGGGVQAAEGMNSFCVEGVGNTYGAGAQQAPGDCPT